MTRNQVFWFGIAIINALVLIVLAWVHAVAGPLGSGFEQVAIAHVCAAAAAFLAGLAGAE